MADDETNKPDAAQLDLPDISESDKPPADKRKTTLKDRISIVIASLALIISALTAFFTTIRQQDDVRVVIQGDLFIRADERIDNNQKLPATAVQTDQNLIRARRRGACCRRA